MILEEFLGCVFSLCSSLITHTRPISRGNVPRENSLIFEDDPEQQEAVQDGLIHCEYEQESLGDVPYYEEDLSVLALTHDGHSSRNFTESFFRSCKANIGLLMVVVFILGLLTFGLVFVDLNTTNACIEWAGVTNLTVPSNVRIQRILGLSATFIPLYTWFPACIVMLWGFREFKKNYLLCGCVFQLVMGSISCVYRIFIAVKLITANTGYSEYRLVNMN